MGSELASVGIGRVCNQLRFLWRHSNRNCS